MRIGRLNQRITIERQIITGVSPSNEPIHDWDELRSCWSEVYTVRGTELWSEEDSKQISETTTRFRIHLADAAGIDTSMRIKFENRYYNIKSVLPDHIRKTQATIDAVAQNASVSGAPLELFAEIDDAGTVGVVFQYSIHVFGGVTPYNVSLTDGSPIYTLPPGLNLVQVSETVWGLEGYPTTPGAYPISIICTDAANNVVALEPFTLTISADGSP